MKFTAIFLMGLMASVTAFAANSTGSEILASLNHLDQAIQKATFDTEGRLVVTFLENNCLAIRNLTEDTKGRMEFLARSLAKAEVVTEKQLPSCSLHIDPRYVFELSVNESDSSPPTGSQMKTVLTRSSCALTTYTHPKDERLLLNAQLLKESLWTLAHETRCGQGE